MISEKEFYELLEKYGLNPEIAINNNDKVLVYTDYYEADKILSYLIDEIKVHPKKIEKAPSILCFSNKENIKENYEYLIKKGLDLKKISSALTVLSTPHDDLVANYEYIEEHLDKSLIMESLSTLSIEPEIIVKIVSKFEESGMTHILINYPITISNIKDSNNVDEIEKILALPFFKEHPDKMTSSIFLRTADELEDIINIQYFKDHPNKIKGTIFLRTAKEIEEIVNLKYFKDHPNKLTATVFHRTPDEVKEIINLPYFKKYPERLTPSIFLKTPDEVKKIIGLQHFKKGDNHSLGTAVHRTADEIEAITNLEFFKKNPEKLTSTVFSRTADEITEILEIDFFHKYPEKLTPCVFLKTPQEIRDILNIPYFKEHPEKVSGTVFHSNAHEIEELLSIEYFKKHPDALKGIVFKKKANDIKESINFIENELELPEGVDLCTPLVFIHKKKHIADVVEFLRGIDENLISVLTVSASILNLPLDEIKLRFKVIMDNEMPIVVENGQFNSIFGMPRKRFSDRYGVTLDDLQKQNKTNPEKKLIITKK